MKIYLTGGTGFVGRHLQSFYQDHLILLHQRGQNAQEQCDSFEPDVILNCAAEIYDPDLMFDSNINLTYQCLKYVKSNTRTKMIQIGSSSEYGPVERPTQETDRVNPVDMYQATKGAATILAQGFARQWALNIGIARPYSIYGLGEKSHRLFPRLLNACYKQQHMTLYQGYHDWIYIDDFIRGINIMVTCDLQQPGDIVNFGSGVQLSNFEVADIFQEVTGTTAAITRKDSLAKIFESQTWVCDTHYARSAYNFEIKYNIKDGIAKFLKSWENNAYYAA